MPSLRVQLAFWLLTPLLAVWAFNAWLTYENAIESANRAHDRTLLGSVLAIAERISVVDDAIVVDLPYSSLEMLESSLQSRVYYRVSQAGARHITGYEDLRPPAAKLELGKPYFYDSEYLGERVRVAAMLKRLYEESIKEPVLIQVAETAELRHSMSWQIVSASVVKELLLILLAAALMWWAVNRGLRPLYKLQEPGEPALPHGLEPHRGRAGAGRAEAAHRCDQRPHRAGRPDHVGAKAVRRRRGPPAEDAAHVPQDPGRFRVEAARPGRGERGARRPARQHRARIAPGRSTCSR